MSFSTRSASYIQSGAGFEIHDSSGASSIGGGVVSSAHRSPFSHVAGWGQYSVPLAMSRSVWASMAATRVAWSVFRRAARYALTAWPLPTLRG